MQAVKKVTVGRVVFLSLTIAGIFIAKHFGLI